MKLKHNSTLSGLQSSPTQTKSQSLSPAADLPRRMGSLGKHLTRPLIQTFARCPGHHKRLGMYLRRDAKHEFADAGFSGLRPIALQSAR